MSLEPHIFFDEVNERQGVFHRRAFILGGLAGAGRAGPRAGGCLQLQLVEAQTLHQTSRPPTSSTSACAPPPRGRILDRNGVELASNRPELPPADAHATRPRTSRGTLDTVAELVPDHRPSSRPSSSGRWQNGPRSAPVAVADDLTWEEFARVNVRAPELPGVTADMGEARVYPFGGAFAHVIGYVSKVSRRTTCKKAGDNPDPLLLHPGFRIGKQGVEKALDLRAARQARRPEGRGRQPRAG